VNTFSGTNRNIKLKSNECLYLCATYRRDVMHRVYVLAINVQESTKIPHPSPIPNIPLHGD